MGEPEQDDCEEEENSTVCGERGAVVGESRVEEEEEEAGEGQANSIAEDPPDALSSRSMRRTTSSKD
jgi:hypothetical protein